MLALLETIIIGERRFRVYENTNSKRKAWQVFERGKSVFGPASMKKCYEWIDEKTIEIRVTAATRND